MLCFVVAAGIAAASGGSPIQRAPAAAAKLENPYQGQRPAQLAGAKLYARDCASCHGANRQGGSHAPALPPTDLGATSAGTLFWVLRNGSLRRGMPSFAHLPEAQRWQIITFLRTAPDRK